jgi:hypothetical protein|tara:strand:+ start:3516 stop:4076 length:561 start_codon:yes stop_codon:yes gene_type:complete
MSRYTYNENDPWIWTRATAQDVPSIVNLTDQNFSPEVDDVIFTKNPTRLHYHLQQAVLKQFYLPKQELVTVARDKNTQQLLAWGWLERNKYTVYADEEMAVAEFIHLELTSSTRTKLTLTAQLLESWSVWCEINAIPVLCSTTIRENQAGFMRLHKQLGFVVRGSFAYKKIKGESNGTSNEPKLCS